MYKRQTTSLVQHISCCTLSLFQFTKLPCLSSLLILGVYLRHCIFCDCIILLLFDISKTFFIILCQDQKSVYEELLFYEEFQNYGSGKRFISLSNNIYFIRYQFVMFNVYLGGRNLWPKYSGQRETSLLGDDLCEWKKFYRRSSKE